jgi:hypothetical protein
MGGVDPGITVLLIGMVIRSRKEERWLQSYLSKTLMDVRARFRHRALGLLICLVQRRSKGLS